MDSVSIPIPEVEINLEYGYGEKEKEKQKELASKNSYRDIQDSDKSENNSFGDVSRYKILYEQKLMLSLRL